MAASPRSSQNKRTTPRKNARTRKKQSARVSTGNWLTRQPLAVFVALVFGVFGIYLLAQSGALGRDEVLLRDNPARGLVYEGRKVKTKGPCAGGFDVTTAEDEKLNKRLNKDIRRCSHLDPGPPGVDIRERIKTVDRSLAALAAHDAKYRPAKSNETSGYEQPGIDEAETVVQWTMNGLGGRDWPCLGNGKDGARVELIYVYPSGGTNRLSNLRGGFNAIARRINQIYFASGKDSGNAHQIRFVTNHGGDNCNLQISAEGIRGDKLNDDDFVEARLAERGYKGIPVSYDITGDGEPDITDYVNRKYLIWIDHQYANRCGLGEIRNDDSVGQTNANNHSVTYAEVWKGCWNYGEPHELMHMLGGVQKTAPRATDGHHCYDERDAMCYDDDGPGGVWMRNVCTRAIDWWRMDCNHNDYYRGNSPSSGYLSRHWNTANNRFLTR